MIVIADPFLILRIILESYEEEQTIIEFVNRTDIAITETVQKMLLKLEEESSELERATRVPRSVWLFGLKFLLIGVRVIREQLNKNTVNAIRKYVNNEQRARSIAEAMVASSMYGKLKLVTMDESYVRDDVVNYLREKGLEVIYLYPERRNVKRFIESLIP